MKRNITQSLGNGLVISTDAVHTFGTDAIVLADFAGKAPAKKCVELGTGCGIITLLLSKNSNINNIDAVDIQMSAVELCQKNVYDNNLQNRITVHCLDLKEIVPNKSLPLGSYDLLVMNPPYKKINGGVISPDRSRAIARHEIACTLRDVVQCAGQLLNTGGRFCLCHRPERLTDVMELFRQYSLEPKRLKFVCQNTSSRPNLFVVEGKKGSSVGGLSIEPTLFIEKDGKLTDDMKKTMGEYYSQVKE